MDFLTEYMQKVTTADEAVKVVQDGDLVAYSEHSLFPRLLDEALGKRADSLNNVAVRLVNPQKIPGFAETTQDRSKIAWIDGHFNGISRKAQREGRVNYLPGAYHHQDRAYKSAQIADVVFLQVSPMDEHGYFNFGVGASGHSAMLASVRRNVVVETNPAIPVCFGGDGERIHISDVSHVVEGDYHKLLEIPDMEPSEVDKKIASMLINEIPNGACLQLGIGGLPNAVGNLICDSDLKELGVHTEMLTQAYYNIYKEGKITGKHKNIDKGKMVYTFAMGQQSLYDFLDHNPECAAYNSYYTNNPANIAANDNVISINNALEVDLYTQVSSESTGTQQISGTGGQLDFVIGAYNSNGGKSFICLTSTYTDKQGVQHSRIKPTFSQGTNVTVPRSVTHYIVTEYGVKDVSCLSTWGRAEAMINLAHPDFRDELIKEAEKMNIWSYTNKKI